MASANGLITAVIIGNLGADPEMRYTPGGHAVTNFRMAVNQRVPLPRAQGQEETTWDVKAQWFKVSVWGKQAEACNMYLKKGSKVAVDIERFNFDLDSGAPVLFTRQDGTAGANYEVTARTVRFLDALPADQGAPPQEEVIPFN